MLVFDHDLLSRLCRGPCDEIRKYEMRRNRLPARTPTGFYPLAQGWMRWAAGIAACPGSTSHKYFPLLVRGIPISVASNTRRGKGRSGHCAFPSLLFSNQLHRFGGGEDLGEGELPIRAAANYNTNPPAASRQRSSPSPARSPRQSGRDALPQCGGKSPGQGPCHFFWS